ncbi:MAG: ribonuclease H-like domain-containing protein [Myxococcota bacterium]|nr:ribonuclease H-like domain-containing protein [Myxococcota bacterium]
MPQERNGDEWLWGWDPTPGIVSVWAEGDGLVHVWRRVSGALVHETTRFRPWVLSRSRDPRTTRELEGPGELRYVVRADDMRALGFSRDEALVLPPEEQYLVASGRTYFRGMRFDDVRRMQIDLETTGLDPQHDRIFLIAVRDHTGAVEMLENDDEAALIRALVDHVRAADPDVIENHNLHGFDLPFLDRRAQLLGVPLALGRIGHGLRQRGARRGVAIGDDRKVRFIAPGRELIDTLDAVLRYDFSTRELGGHGLKGVAKHLGVAGADREHISGDRIHAVYGIDPDRVRRYARADVEEVAQISRLLGGAAFALAQMAPRRYERLADAGPATGVIDPLLVRAYLRANEALPAHAPGDGTEHSGAALHLYAAGVARRVVKADVASLYPSLMREFRIGPARDRLGVMLALVDRLVEQRLAAKAAAKLAPAGSAERHTHEAMSAAMKLVVNSAYGYLGAGGLTRFSDVHAANEVTRHGRETLALMCNELAARGVTLLEADTDGVYFAVPEGWTTDDERRVVAEVGALLPPLVQLELEGRYAAMLSHEPKNYALLHHDGTLTLRGVAFRSSRTEPFAERFLRAAIERLFADDVAGVRAVFLHAIDALRRREVPTYDVSSRTRLSKSRDEYLATREARRELPYEALLAANRRWDVGERVRVYRTRESAALVEEDRDPRDYDSEHYARILREQYATRFSRALAPEDFAAVFADPDQLQLFARSLADARPVLTRVS